MGQQQQQQWTAGFSRGDTLHMLADLAASHCHARRPTASQLLGVREGVILGRTTLKCYVPYGLNQWDVTSSLPSTNSLGAADFRKPFLPTQSQISWRISGNLLDIRLFLNSDPVRLTYCTTVFPL